MDDLQRFVQRNLRRIAAIGGLLLSLIAVSILLNTGPKTSVWMIVNPVANGSKITAKDVELVRANLTTDSNHFEGSSSSVIGQYATRLLHIGDLIAVTDVNHTGENNLTSFLPIGIAVNDLPLDLTIGDLVDIYVIPKDQSILPALIAHRVVIQSVDQKSRSLGGNVSVSVDATASVTAIIVTAESQGRLVLARDSI